MDVNRRAAQEQKAHLQEEAKDALREELEALAELLGYVPIPVGGTVLHFIPGNALRNIIKEHLS